ncbi:Rft protein-domain-containing protein [Dipodascopsis uninucleata]
MEMSYVGLNNGLARSSTVSKRHGRRHSTIVVPPPASLTASRESQPDTTRNIMESSAKGATSLFVLQIFSKVITFALNHALLRFTSPDRLGVSSQLELLNASILLFSRETIRLSLQRQTMLPKPDIYRIEGGVVEGTVSGIAQSVVNTGYIPVMVGLPITLLFCFYYYFRGAGAEIASLPYFKSVVIIYGVASVVELLSEPMFALAQYNLQYKLRALCESSAVISRCAVTFFLTVSAPEDTGALPFALGQLAYAIVLTGAYFCLVWETTRGKENGILPKKIWREEISRSPWFYFHDVTMKMATTIWAQTVLKHCLTEADKLFASYFSTISEQGIYALAANYGSLIARLIFAPVEETVRILFAKLLSPPLTISNLRSSSDTLTTILRVYCYISLCSIIFGPALAPTFIGLVAGKQWTANISTSSVLSVYTYYIPFLAINGVLEAFFQSTATPEQIRQQSIALSGLPFVFGASGYILMRVFKIGASGLIYANILSMFIRILLCVVWITRFYDENEISVDEKSAMKEATGRNQERLSPLRRRTAYPSTQVLLSCASAWTIIKLLGNVQSISKGLVVMSIVVLVVSFIAYDERGLLNSMVPVIISFMPESLQPKLSSISSLVSPATPSTASPNEAFSKERNKKVL